MSEQDIVARIDGRLVGAAGVPVGWLEARGTDQWDTARHLLLAGLVLFAGQMASAVATTRDAGRLADLAVLMLVMVLVAAVSWWELGRQAGSRQGAQTALLGEAVPRSIVLVAVALLAWPMAVKTPLLLAGFGAYLAHFYAKACTPRPPVPRGRLAAARG